MKKLGIATDYLKKRKAIVVALAAMVVFVTTYMLILPAVTLDEETASAQGGIDHLVCIERFTWNALL